MPVFNIIERVSEADLPKEIVDFIAEHITSMEQLEVLLLLHDHPEKDWTVEAVFSQIQSSPASVAQRLQEFYEKGFFAQPDLNTFRFSPKTQDLFNTVRALAATYKEKRVKIIELIYRKPVDDVQSFADAFKLRKDKPNG
jgi:hypothetical protein